MLLRAVATDLSSEIRGERVRFIEAMREATTMNMQSESRSVRPPQAGSPSSTLPSSTTDELRSHTVHVDEFKKALTNEVSQSMRELGTLREQKKALEHRIADLFALIAKHGEEGVSATSEAPGEAPQVLSEVAERV